MTFFMSPEVEALLCDLNDFEIVVPKAILLGNESALFDGLLSEEREIGYIEKTLRELRSDIPDSWGPGMSYLCGMVETYGGKVWVSIASKTEYKLSCRYDEENMRNTIASLKDGIAAEEESGGDPTMVEQRIKGYRWQIEFIERKLNLNDEEESLSATDSATDRTAVKA